MHLMRILVAIVTTFIFAGCRTTALVHKKDGTVIEGKVTRSNASTLFVVPAEPSGANVIEPSEISESAKGTIIPELLDECAPKKIAKCKEECRDRYIGGVTEAEALKCVKACPDLDKARSLCEAISVEIPIARADIDDIDHPGDDGIYIGLPTGVLGIIVAAIGFYHGTHDAEATLSGMPVLVLGALTSVSGFAVGIWGTATYSRSTSAARPPGTGKKPKLTPVAISDGERTYWGIGMLWSW